MMEEILTGELAEDGAVLLARARTLMSSLAVEEEEGTVLPHEPELVQTVVRTLALPEIVELRQSLVPEWPIYAVLQTRGETAVSGRIDAVAMENATPSVVIDWKSDVAPLPEEVDRHRKQMHDYLTVTGATRGALVYMTPGRILWVDARE